MEQIVDELIAQGYEVTGSDSMIQVKLGGLSGKAGIRKSTYSNSYVFTNNTVLMLIINTALLSSFLSSLYIGLLEQKDFDVYNWATLTIGIPSIIAGYICLIISEIQMQPIRKIVRLANAKISGT
ncbi:MULTISPECIES: hypothetical protein [Vibrio]|uniref:hypothetical protein n=1 Tax=Vibrio TaxID=662 RepID=UPI002074C94F|nr:MULTISPECIES: hypothetical protein [Vibrio]USD33756.1 hypothetical protein J8Z27_06580 [Vibrio sp. SCSIO 43186]USD46827.1 hypothetical protein J4N38_06780 [Vibrio sp. SCSIO 43145]USD70881.1 hypothetical protein J4N41_06585 [Vibrio sp. SCSIO 43139]USD95791.1 hypothetical protein CTT30_06690 [Vibrio coralliilyticus]